MTNKVHLIIPDVQAKPGNDWEFLRCIGRFIVDKKPDVVVQIGDFADMASLSSYDIGKKSFEGRRYKSDVVAAHEAMEALLTPLMEFNQRAKKNKEKQYHPRKILTIGNHENRIERAVENDPKLEGVLSIGDLRYQHYGWEVYPFLDVVVVNDICYSHYFTSGVLGRPVSSARMLVQKKHMNAVMGHVQHWDMHREVRADGQPIVGLFAGSCYEHNEDYLGAQGNNYARGIWILHEVGSDVGMQPMFVSLDFLKRRYKNG